MITYIESHYELLYKHKIGRGYQDRQSVLFSICQYRKPRSAQVLRESMRVYESAIAKKFY